MHARPSIREAMIALADDAPVGAAWQRAVDQINEWIIALHARSLTSTELLAYRLEAARAGWRLDVSAESKSFTLDVVVDATFPRRAPKVFLVGALPFPSYPHVERNGCLCILSANAEVDHNAPVGTFKHILAGAADLLEKGVSGANTSDFLDEFRSYWVPTAHGLTVHSTVAPEGPSRLIHMWRGKTFHLVADSREGARQWLNNFSKAKPNSSQTIQEALFVWLDRPLLPAEYPTSSQGVVALLARSANDPMPILKGLATRQATSITVIFGAPTTNGSCLWGVDLVRPKGASRGKGRRGSDPVAKGFRPNSLPDDTVAGRFLGSAPIQRLPVDRADPAWVHGRDGNAQVEVLKAASACIVGCGSLGAPVARLLTQAGVGRLVLIDPETLSWANTGRHALGAPAVGKSKAEALSMQLRADYPSLSVEHHERKWQQVNEIGSVLGSCNLIVSTIGSWAAEGALNEWHMQSERTVPVLYGWTEPHACAGHSVLIGQRGACLACGMSSFGKPRLKITDWPADREIRQEPACGAFYQAYGPIELTHTASLIAEHAVDVLLDPHTPSSRRVWVGLKRRLTPLGGSWSGPWLSAGGRDEGGYLTECDWPQSPVCEACGGVS